MTSNRKRQINRVVLLVAMIALASVTTTGWPTAASVLAGVVTCGIIIEVIKRIQK